MVPYHAIVDGAISVVYDRDLRTRIWATDGQYGWTDNIKHDSNYTRFLSLRSDHHRRQKTGAAVGFHLLGWLAVLCCVVSCLDQTILSLLAYSNNNQSCCCSRGKERALHDDERYQQQQQ